MFLVVGKMHWESKHYLIVQLNKLDKIICERNIRYGEKKDTGLTSEHKIKMKFSFQGTFYMKSSQKDDWKTAFI